MMSDETQPGHELSVTRLIDAPVETVWRVWTERTAEWFAPKPWTTRIIEQDYRAGGRTAIEMTGPNGESPGANEGVFLEVTPHERIVFTDAFAAGWIPQKPFMTGFFEFADEGGKTRYTAGARHWDADARRRHEEMGFIAGWGTVADQLAALAEEEARG
jgi:uncharacterized protein YndB with AHSA1/START domain